MSRVDTLTDQPAAHPGAACRAWYAVLALVISATLITQIVLLWHGGADVNTASNEAAVGPAVRYVRLFSFFTVESNLLVLALAVSLVLDPARDGRVWRVLNVDALLGITITGLVFGAVLAGQVQHHGIDIWVNAGFHYFAPGWAVAGWLLFGPRPRTDWATLGWLFAWPLLWIVYTFAHGAATGWYPYPFLNAHTHGYGVALRNTAAVVVLALVIAGIVRLLDRRLPVVTR
ncbi:MAG TPA: Pr6Pr family membrane protein [Trebonia sp.]